MNLLKKLAAHEVTPREYFTIGAVALFNVVTFTFFHLYVQALGMLVTGLSSCWLGIKTQRKQKQSRPAQRQEFQDKAVP